MASIFKKLARTKPYDPEYLLSKIRGLFEYPTQFVNNPREKCVEVIYNNKKYTVRSSRTQTISMLLATYENEIIQNRELQSTQEELKLLNEKLEDRVRERTAELRESDERLRAVLETANDALSAWTAAGASICGTGRPRRCSVSAPRRR